MQGVVGRGDALSGTALSGWVEKGKELRGTA